MDNQSLRSAPDRAQAESDPRGNDRGIIERGSDVAGRTDLVSIRWVARIIAVADRALVDDEPADGREYAKRLAEAARSLEHGAALARAFPLLWRARNGRVRAGELIDAADLFIAGHGAIDDIVAGLVAGRFDELPRDDEGFLILEEPE